MSTLARIAARDGHEVTGSDEKIAPHKAENAYGADLVVYSSAVSQDNPEIAWAREHGVPTLSRAEYLGKTASEYEAVFAVCGCHGKTTTTAMLYAILKFLHPTLHLGGKIEGEEEGEKKILITEACEYKRNFLTLKPTFGIFTNVDYDHPDCYENLSDVKAAYADFYDNCGVAVVNADDANSKFLRKKSKTVTYGVRSQAEFSAQNVVPTCSGYRFEATYRECYLGEFILNVKGAYNLSNAMAAIACAFTYGIGKNEIVRGLADFCGVKRRHEWLKKLNSCNMYTDYAHHPREIESEIDLLKRFHKRVAVVFQPHTFSRTNRLLDGFVQSLQKADTVVLLPTYASRERGEENGELLARLQEKTDARSIPFSRAATWARENAAAFDAICFMGAGDIDDQARRV